MDNAIIHEVIAINNRCIENVTDVNIAHSLSELHLAMYMFKQRVAAVESSCRETCVPELQQGSSLEVPRPPPPMLLTNQDLQGHHHLPREPSSTTVTVRIEIGPNATTSTSSNVSSSASPTPIARCQHLFLLVAVDRVNTSPSLVKNQGSVSGTEASADVHLICATLMYNMGLLCHKYAYIENHTGRGSHHSAPDTASMIRASKIYELLIELCNQSSIVQASHHSPDKRSYLRIIRMVAYNNYAEICYTFGNHMKYKDCMNAIQYQLDLFSFTTGNNSFLEHIYSEIRLNVIMYKLCPVPTLASAA